MRKSTALLVLFISLFINNSFGQATSQETGESISEQIKNYFWHLDQGKEAIGGFLTLNAKDWYGYISQSPTNEQDEKWRLQVNEDFDYLYNDRKKAAFWNVKTSTQLFFEQRNIWPERLRKSNPLLGKGTEWESVEFLFYKPTSAHNVSFSIYKRNGDAVKVTILSNKMKVDNRYYRKLKENGGFDYSHNNDVFDKYFQVDAEFELPKGASGKDFKFITNENIMRDDVFYVITLQNYNLANIQTLATANSGNAYPVIDVTATENASSTLLTPDGKRGIQSGLKEFEKPKTDVKKRPAKKKKVE
ncbi:MAG: hypothetical protein R2739_08815 [Chitinophagales bacterium]